MLANTGSDFLPMLLVLSTCKDLDYNSFQIAFVHKLLHNFLLLARLNTNGDLVQVEAMDQTRLETLDQIFGSATGQWSEVGIGGEEGVVGIAEEDTTGWSLWRASNMKRADFKLDLERNLKLLRVIEVGECIFIDIFILTLHGLLTQVFTAFILPLHGIFSGHGTNHSTAKACYGWRTLSALAILCQKYASLDML